MDDIVWAIDNLTRTVEKLIGSVEKISQQIKDFKDASEKENRRIK